MIGASVCSVIGAPEAAARRLGWPDFAWCAEVERFPRRVLAERFPHTPNLGDITADDFVTRAINAGVPDVLIGGTPCQAFSVAGARNGLKDERGSLSLRFVEICNEINPDWIIWENFPGVLSDKTNAFGCMLGGLAGADSPVVLPWGGSWPNAGVVAGPRRRLVWRVLDAQYWGVAQRRRRVFVVACRRDRPGLDPVSVLFERAGVCGHPTARGASGKIIAGTLSARTSGGGGLGTDFECDGGLIAFDPCQITSPTNRSRPRAGAPAYTIHAEPQMIAFHARQSPISSQDCSLPLDTDGSTVGLLAPTLTASNDPSRSPQSHEVTQQVCSVHRATGGVRRLMPVECERLQGFDDGWTAIGGASDGARYRAIGNSMAVPCVQWILTGIESSASNSKAGTRK